jgi:hypothetical protein
MLKMILILSNRVVTCAWETSKSSARRIGITIGCLFVPIFLIVWLVRESTMLGKLFGILYMLLALLAAVGFSWMMVTKHSSN